MERLKEGEYDQYTIYTYMKKKLKPVKIILSRGKRDEGGGE
jgi:hypothetical protein